MLVEFENVFLIGGNWGQLGANVLVEFKIFFNWGHFSFPNWGQLWANVLVEFENVFLIGGIFF